MDSDRAAVTVVGLGQMGSALASVLLERGHPLTVWNRSAPKAQPLLDRGARLAATPEEAIVASPLTIICVRDHAALRSTIDPAAGALADRELVNFTSGTPGQAVATEEWAHSHGARYLDGAIMTTPPGVGNPERMFLYSGSTAVFGAHRPTLAALGDPLHLGTDAGLASLYDAALLGLMWSTMNGWLHGTALVGSEGIEAKAFTPIAIRWLNDAVVGFLKHLAAQVDDGEYPDDGATVDVQIAAIDHLMHTAADRGIDNALPEVLKATMERARDAGHGSASYASLVELLKKPADRT